MKDAEFIVDGYLSKDYFAKVAADLGWRLRPGESSDEVWVDDENVYRHFLTTIRIRSQHA
jgi:hypothetical protein